MGYEIDSLETGTQITVKVVSFKSGPKYARQLGGKYDPESKLWSLSLTDGNRAFLRAPGLYGLAIVTAPTQPVEASYLTPNGELADHC